MITEELITYKTAQLAKQAGFDAPCFYYYYANQILQEPYLENGSSTDCDFRVDLTDLLDNRNCKSYENSNNEIISAPSQSLLQRWLREVYEIHMYPTRCKFKTKYSWIIFEDNKVLQGEKWKTYELALEQALQEALTIIINRKDAHLS
jgi:hypothetical protein